MMAGTTVQPLVSMATVLADIQSDPWMIVTAVGTGAAAVAAAVSAFFSWRSSRDAANAAQATLYRTFQEEYASDEMGDALRRLSEWYWRFKDQKLDFASEWKKQWESADPEARAEARAVDESRRRVSHFFGAIADLRDNRLLSRPIARRLASLSGDLVFVVVEPLEKKRNPEYNKSHFDILASLTRYSGRRA